MRLVGHVLALGLTLAPVAVEAQEPVRPGILRFENADIQAVIEHVGRLTGLTFLFDPAQVKGRITLLPPKTVSPAEALELLKSALALHGYSLVGGGEATWIVHAGRVAHEGMIVKVVPLTYARAGELAYTLSWIVPPPVRVIPYFPTNSLIISGPPALVEELIGIIKPSP